MHRSKTGFSGNVFVEVDQLKAEDGNDPWEEGQTTD